MPQELLNKQLFEELKLTNKGELYLHGYKHRFYIFSLAEKLPENQIVIQFKGDTSLVYEFGIQYSTDRALKFLRYSNREF